MGVFCKDCNTRTSRQTYLSKYLILLISFTKIRFTKITSLGEEGRVKKFLNFLY